MKLRGVPESRVRKLRSLVHSARDGGAADLSTDGWTGGQGRARWAGGEAGPFPKATWIPWEEGERREQIVFF